MLTRNVRRRIVPTMLVALAVGAATYWVLYNLLHDNNADQLSATFEHSFSLLIGGWMAFIVVALSLLRAGEQN